MKTDRRRLVKVWNITAEWNDESSFTLTITGTTARSREMAFEAVVPFNYFPYLVCSLMKHWIEAKRRRLDEIGRVDDSLPKTSPQ